MPNRIRELRAARNLTLEEVAERAATTPQQVSRLERAQRRLTDQWMQRLATALGVRPADLFPNRAPDDRIFVENAEERSLLRAWRLMRPEDKRAVANYMRGVGLELLLERPKNRRAV